MAEGILVQCSECGRPVDERSPLTMFEVTGWAKRRKQGGLHGLSFKYETGRLMCGGCATKRRLTGSAQQGQML